MHAIAKVAGLVVAFGLGIEFLEQARAEQVFDAPVGVRHVRLKADPLNPQTKSEVTCFDYQKFVIKQVDLGEVGADRLSILPSMVGKKTPCRKGVEPNEYVIPADVWSGYFRGVKADFAFFNAADGIHGGLGFMVFSLSGKKKVFEDTAQKGFSSIDAKTGLVKLRYQRVFASKCSVVATGDACRESIVSHTGVSMESLSSCNTGYQTAKQAMAKARCEANSKQDRACAFKEVKNLETQKWDDAPSVIVYEVQTTLDASPVIQPLGGAIACRPSD